jgi:glycosyltransferase involved in cell wall biosynthesis
MEMFSNNLKIIFKFFIILIIPIIFVIFKDLNYIKEKRKESLLLKIENIVKNNHITDKDIKDFHRINSWNILLDNKKYNKEDNPIISVIVIVYNQKYCIHNAIRSIQNQSIKNLEIIIIDDCSSDNSNEIIKKYQEEDNRIILIKHEVNQGKIKSRSDGVRIASGKYITVLDGDDGLIHKDILNHSLYIANLGNLDVVEFKIMAFNGRSRKQLLNKYTMENNDILYQPKLRTKFFFFNNDPRYRAFQNRNICGKIIRNKIFKKVLNRIGPKYTEDYILFYEDTIMAFTLFQIANSYYYMKEEGYYYSKEDKGSKLLLSTINNFIPKVNETIIKGIDPIKYLQFLVEKTRNNKIERQLIYHEIISINYVWNFYKYINHHFKMLFDILDKMIINRFLLKDQKQRLILIKKSLQEKENKLLNISFRK